MDEQLRVTIKAEDLLMGTEKTDDPYVQKILDNEKLDTEQKRLYLQSYFSNTMWIPQVVKE